MNLERGRASSKVSCLLEIGFFIVIPILAFFVFRYSLINQEDYVDPWLYTGLAQNFQMIWQAGGLNYYLVRFSVILPMHLAYLCFGDIGGYIAVHLLAYVILTVPLYLAIRRLFCLWVAVATLCFFVSTPIAARFLLWDYVNFLAVPYFVATISFAYLARNRSPSYWMLSGIFAMSAVAAHPFTLAGIGLFFLSDFLVVVVGRERPLALALIERIWAGIGATVCALAGWLGYVLLLGWIAPLELVRITVQSSASVIGNASNWSLPVREWVVANFDAYIPLLLLFGVCIALIFNRIKTDLL